MAGCGQVWSSNGTPPSTRQPTLPLLGYTLVPPSLTPSLWPVYTPTPLLTSEGSGLGPALYLTVIGPTCYETPVSSLICLGQVRNTLGVPVEHVTVGVQLLDRNGTPLAQGETFLSRVVLPAGLVGPYRVLFERIPEGYAGAYGFVKSGQVATDAGVRYAELELRQLSGTFVMDQYQVALSVVNKSRYPVEHVSVTMTLLDRDGNVTGFRQVYLEAGQRLKPGESLALTMKVIPQGPNTVGFDAFAEGRLVRNN